MGYHPRIESSDLASFGTIRTINSQLWFINNEPLEDAILGYVAKYAERYELQIYGFGIEGNHLHSLSHYPKANRADFKRDLNSSVARALPRYVSKHPGGPVWGRRYSAEFVPENDDIEDRFFYLVLQPVKDGLVDRIGDYPGYNCFSDAVKGITRKFKMVHWAEYNDRKRWDPQVKMKDYTYIVELKYERLPGYEDLSQKEYSQLMHEKLEERRQKLILEREGKPCMGRDALLALKPGVAPKRSKVSGPDDYRPRVLCGSRERERYYLEWYFDIYWEFREASAKFRAGELTAEFPAGTYRPPLFTCQSAAPP